MDAHTYSLDTTWRVLFKDLGIDAANVLRRAGLPDDLLQNANARLPVTDYYRLWGGIEAETQDPGLPIRICEAARSETFSPPFFAALCSPNLLVAGQRIAKFKPLVAPIKLDVVEHENTVSVEFLWLDDPVPKPATLVMMELMISVAVARIGTRERVAPVEVMTNNPIDANGRCEEYLGTKITCGPTNKVTFRKEDALKPFLTSNAGLWEAFEPGLRQRLNDLEANTSTVCRVKAVLLEGLPSGRTSIDTVASRLAMSKRTLQRRIEAEGFSYQDVLMQTRRSLAQHYLGNTSLPVPEISFLLGYEEPNSFYRAFRAWTGTTPEQFTARAANTVRYA